MIILNKINSIFKSMTKNHFFLLIISFIIALFGEQAYSETNTASSKVVSGYLGTLDQSEQTNASSKVVSGYLGNIGFSDVKFSSSYVVSGILTNSPIPTITPSATPSPTPDFNATPTPTSTPSINEQPSPTPTSDMNDQPSPTPTLVPVNGFTIGGSELSASPGSNVNVPIDVSGLPETTAITFDLTFDNSILSWNQTIQTDSTLLADWGLADANLLDEDTLIISSVAVNSDPIQGIGTLLKVPFTVDANINHTTTILNITNLKDGLVSASSQEIVLTIATGMKGDVNLDGEVTASDAQLTFDIVLGKVTPTDEQFNNAEVTGDNQVTAADAQLIFDVVLGKASFNTNSIQAKQVFLSQLAENTIQVDSTSVASNQDITIPVRINTTKEITTFTIDIRYDTESLNFQSLSKENSIAKDFLLFDANEVEPGLIRIAAAALSSPTISGEGILFKLNFIAEEDASGVTDVHINSIKDDITNFDVSNGSIDFNTVIHHWSFW